MKRLLLLSITLCTFLYVFSQERTVERPPFSVRNYGTLEIEKIVLTSKATVMHFTGYQQPGSWFRIDTGTYIVANGKKYLVEFADGLKLDEETYPDESGKHVFTLTFPAIDPKTEQIDFIESDCDNCFKIWGIELKSDVLTNRIPVPDEVKKLATTEIKGSLQPTGFKQGKARLKGQIIGYHPDMKVKGELYVNNPLTGDQEEYNFTIAVDGTFDTQIPLPTSMQVFVGLSGLLWNTILMAPEEETLIYVDLQQKSCQESIARKDKCPAGKWIYFGGALADINNYYFDNNLSDLPRPFFDYRNIERDVEGMSAHEYKNYILDNQKKTLQALLERNVPTKVHQLMEITIHQAAIYWLMMGDYFLEAAYRKKNNIERRAPIPEYNRPIFDLEYYQFLKDMDMNNPLNLYCSEYSSSVRGCGFLSLNRNRIYAHNYPDIAEELIRITDMTPEELAYADYLITQKYENWPADKVATEKQKIKNQLNMYDKDKFTDEIKNKLARLEELISDSNIGYREFNQLYMEFMIAHQDVLLSANAQKTEVQTETVEFKADDPFSSEFIEAFNEKYKEHTDMLFADDYKKGAKEMVATILGTDKGLLFDLMRVQQYGSSLEEMVPVSSVKIERIKKMDDPFYYQYLSARNAEVLAQIEANKKKGGYTVYTAPEVTNDVLLNEIIKPYAGKVIFIDFWNTWCAPCRSAMKEFDPVKQQYKDKEVIFLYLADESSPIKAWENMIVDISGEHYRLNDAQINYLRNKYGVTGIPSYLILNKNGEQVYFQVGFPGNNVITEILNRELNK